MTRRGSVSALKASLLSRLRAGRSGYSLKWIRYLKEQTQELSELSLELQKKRVAVAKEVHTLNKDEYQRRVQLLEGKRASSAETLDRINTQVDTLRNLGITRTTAGFLTWAGYFAFPAAGWFLGEALYDALGSSKNSLGNAVSLISVGIEGLANRLGLVWAAILVFAAPLLLLAIVFALFVLGDYMAGLFDDNWGKHGDNRGASGFYTPPLTQIRRRDYSQVVAKLPLIYSWALLPLGLASLLALSGARNTASLRSIALDPWKAMLYTYLGVALTIVVSGFALLYTCFIVQGRLSAPHSTFASLRLHAELALILLATVLILLIRAASGASLGTPHTDLSRPLLWTLALLAIGFVVAYGLIYKGIFKDQRVLRRQLIALDDAIERYSGLPAVETSDPEAREYRTFLKQLQERFERQWERIDFDPRDLGFSPHLGRIFPARHRRTLSPIGMDFLFEPELTAQLGRIEAAEAVLTAKLGATAEKLVRLERDLTSARTLGSTTASRLTTLRGLRVEAIRRRHTELVVAMRRYGEAIARCKSAYNLGRHLGIELDFEDSIIRSKGAH